MINNKIIISIAATIIITGGISYSLAQYVIAGIKKDLMESELKTEQLTKQVQNLQKELLIGTNKVEGSIVQEPSQDAVKKDVTAPEALRYFDYGRHVIGDRVGGMTISAIASIMSGQSIAPDNLEVVFVGEITLSGRFECPGEGMGSAYDFYPDENNVLPRLKGKNYSEGQWFGLMTQDRSPLLEKPVDLVCGKKATITIDKFVIQNYPSEVQDWAHLIAGKTN